MGGLGIVQPVDTARQKGIMSSMVLFSFGFSLGWGPICYVLTTELSALRLRDHTSRVGFIVNVFIRYRRVMALSLETVGLTYTIDSFVVNFSIPYLTDEKYAGLNSKVGFIFGAFMTVGAVFTFFCVPECKGKALEEVDYVSSIPGHDPKYMWKNLISVKIVV